MSERRTLTIGVAINLGNYESLRLEVSDEVADEQEAAELAAYLNRVLDGYGRNDATARASIDKYRTRILEKYAGEKPAAAPASDPLDELFGPVPVFGEPPKPKEEPKPAMPEPPKPKEEPKPVMPEPPKPKEEPKPAMPEPPKPKEEPKPVMPEPPKPKEEPKPEMPETPASLSPKSAGDAVQYTCEKCGADVSKVQRDVSNLFMGKTLCKSCMK